MDTRMIVNNSTGKRQSPRKRAPLFGVSTVKPDIVLMADQIASSPRHDQVGFMKTYLNMVFGDKILLNQLMPLFSKAWLGKKYAKFERHLENIFKDNINLTPQDAAYELRTRLRIPHEMRPLTISLARLVKNRMRAAQNRAAGEEYEPRREAESHN